MQIKFKDGGSFMLPVGKIAEQIGEVDETELKVLLLMADCAQKDLPFEPDAAAATLGKSVAEITAAVKLWRVAKVIATANTKSKAKLAPPEKPAVKRLAPESRLPEYTSEELSKLVDKNKKMKSLIDACQQTWGKIFNVAEVNLIVGLQDYLGLGGDYILILLAYCKKNDKKSLKYVEKMAFSLCEEDIQSADALEEYLRRQEQLGELENRIRKLFGIGSRAFSKKEKGFIDAWRTEYAFDFDMIETAYEMTVDKTGEASLPYANAILKRWHDDGIATPDAARAASQKQKKAVKGKVGSFDTDDFFEAALNRSYGGGLPAGAKKEK